MMKLLLLVCLVVSSARGDIEVVPEEPTPQVPESVPFSPPARPPGDVYFFESFSDVDSFEKNGIDSTKIKFNMIDNDSVAKAKIQFNIWIKSQATKSEDDTAKYNGEWELMHPTFVGANEQDMGLEMPVENRLYAISSKLEKTFDFAEEKEEFALQFEVNFQEGLNCGGAYVKLLSSDANPDLTQFQDKTPYSIMFGPDKCGQSSKIHFIIRFKNPITGEIEEKHAKQPTSGFEFFNDRMTHLFTLFIRKDGYFSISVDLIVVLSGYLQSDLTPSIVPPKEIDDPNDTKPTDWDDTEKIPEPNVVKPDNWDEDAPKMITNPDAVKPDGWLDEGPETIPDPDASLPEDWDEEEDGEWEAPVIPNPACDEVGCGEWTAPEMPNPEYKGKWKAPLIDNPNYMGIWKPRRIANPAYFELDGSAFVKLTPISALGFELWTVGKKIHFDNIFISSEITAASVVAKDTWLFKMENERVATGSGLSVTSWVDYFIDIANNHPYLWAIYAIILVLPFVLCAACCVRSKPSSRPRDEAARTKKTDEPSKDDESKPEEEESFVASAEDEDKPLEEEKPKEETVRKRKPTKEQEPDDTVETTEPTGEEEEFKEVKKSPRRGGGRKAKTTKRED